MMHLKLIRTPTITLLVALAVCTKVYAVPVEPIDMTSPVVATVGNIEFRDCLLEAGGIDRSAQCAWFTVPQNYQQPHSKNIDLFIVRLPAKKKRKATDPVLFLAGGPGGAASEGYLHADRPFEALSRERDFYLIDQRGTGHSNFLGCDGFSKEQEMLMTINPEKSIALFESVARSCFENLKVDTRFFTTSVAVKDFDLVREALKIDQWNLFGGSYGTRVALHYMRRHPESIRTAVLDSLLPPGASLLTEIALNSQKTLDALYQQCSRNSQCNKQFPNLREHVDTIFSDLMNSPITTQIENLNSGELEKTTFTYGHLQWLLRRYLYETNSLAILPPMLYEASAKNNIAPLARAANNLISSWENVIATAMANAVLCTEDFPYLEIDEETIKALEQTYMGNQVITATEIACKIWPIGVMDSGFRAPLISDIPSLLISGELDPITPPDYAEAVMPGLSTAKHLVLSGQGHGSSVVGCIPSLVEKFVTQASLERLDTSCVKRIEASPLFINFNGPNP